MPSHLSPTVEVNLAAISDNYLLLANKAKSACAAVVKANAYGLGAVHVSRALYQAGCREFFVATLEEAVEVRTALSASNLPAASIYAFHGVRQGQARDFLNYDIIPVLNAPEQIEYWGNAGKFALHVDTGMCRLGIAAGEIERYRPELDPVLVISHLACANEPENPKNSEQLQLFRQALRYFPGVRASFANSSGVFLGQDYHFDLLRPGCSLYGISPNTSLANPMQNVVTLSAPVLQYRMLTEDQTVGYSASVTAKKGSVLATVEMGYADGFFRSLSNKAFGYVAGNRVPLLGRVSMDMVIMDVTTVPERLRTPDMRVVFINDEQTVDMAAKAAGTIGYEIFTRLGARVKRVYSS